MSSTASSHTTATSPTSAKPAPKRVRRTAEEARRLILDAAEKRLATQGPEGIRLQDIARDVGISHPAILHHFESREGLVKALIARTNTQLREKLLTALSNSGDAAQDPIESVFEALSDRGTARLLAWLLLTGRVTDTNKGPQVLMTEIADQLHAHREENANRNGTPAPDREDTFFLAMLTTSAAFGDAIIGRYLAEAAGLDEAGVKRFRNWFGKLLRQHVERTDTPAEDDEAK